MAAAGVSKRGGRYFVADGPNNVISFSKKYKLFNSNGISMHMFPKDETVGQLSTGTATKPDRITKSTDILS